MVEHVPYYEVLETAGVLDEWRVEAVDYDRDGQIYVALFSGPGAEARAREYAGMKNDEPWERAYRRATTESTEVGGWGACAAGWGFLLH